jgi:phosphatidylserine/phosphatidylglycerophosphate/cardiolipin synthase-like enzyme
LTRVFDRDWQPERFGDLHPFDPADERYGGPPEDFTLPEAPSYPTVDERFHAPVTATGSARFGIVSAPENALRPDAGLLTLLAQAGPGDEILLQQLYEHKFWGESTSNPIADPNPRLEATIAAARRGATVRILLDAFFDDPEALRSNWATVDYVRTVAAMEGLDLDARLANPTGGGIHAKLVLVRLGETRWSAVGSLNGSEVSHKLNREIVLLTDQPAVHARLADLFRHDWETGE